MIAPNLPSELKAALARKAEGLSRNDAAQRAGAISQTYRSGGGSGRIRTSEDALAYALARMPATYAAIAASLNALMEVNPDFAPGGVLDIGAGPGTATWAAGGGVRIAGKLHPAGCQYRRCAISPSTSRNRNRRLTSMRYEPGDARKLLAAAPEADFVVASYVINELGDSERAALTDAMWRRLAIRCLSWSPAHPAGYARIIELRARLIAAGAHVIAPCPHDTKCPLTTPDWCHFSQRYVAVARAQTPQGGRTSLRGRKIQLRRIVARAGCTAPRAVAGATAGHEDRGDREKSA